MSGTVVGDNLYAADWGNHLPQPGDFPDTESYLAALEAFLGADPNMQPGEGWTAVHPDGSPVTMGEANAKQFNRLARMVPGNEAQNKYNKLAMHSRAGIRPEEAASAMAAFGLDPDTGLPYSLLTDAAINTLQRYGISLPDWVAPGQTPGETPGREPDPVSGCPQGHVYASDGLCYPAGGTRVGGNVGGQIEDDVASTIPDNRVGGTIGGQIGGDIPNLAPPDYTIEDAAGAEGGYSQYPASQPLGFSGQNLAANMVSRTLQKLQQNPDMYPDWVHKMLRGGR